MYVLKYGMTTINLHMFTIWDLITINYYHWFCGYDPFEPSSSRKMAYL